MSPGILSELLPAGKGARRTDAPDTRGQGSIAHALFATALLAVLALVFCAGFAGMADEDSEAYSAPASHGTASSPLTSINCYCSNLDSTPYYVAVGSSFRVATIGNVIVEELSSEGFGVTYASGNDGLTGTISAVGTFTFRYFDQADADDYTAVTINCVQGSSGTTVPATSVSVSPASVSLIAGSTKALSASVTPSTATDKSVTWSSSKTSVATVDSNGLVTAKSAGSATITCKANGGNGVSTTCSVTVQALTVSFTSYVTSATTGESNTYALKGNAGETSLSLSPTSGWDMTSSGDTYRVTFDSAGTYTVTAKATNGSATATKQITVTVKEPAKQTFYARLYYNANGGSGAPSEQSDSIYATSASGSKEFTVSSTVPTKSGAEFNGWATSADASAAEYRAGDAIYVPYGGTKTLYAVWGNVTYTCILELDANGGQFDPDDLVWKMRSSPVEEDQVLTIMSSVPTKSGKEFKGWADSPTADKASYQPGSKITVAINTTKTLYAVWGTPELTVTSEPPSRTVQVGQTWSYEPSANLGGCAFTVTGADWLTVKDGIISGTPSTTGTYDITVKVSKTGYSDGVQMFTIQVVSQFDSPPSAKGIIAYAE